MQNNETKNTEEQQKNAPDPRAYTMTAGRKLAAEVFEILEMLASVTIVVMICFAFIARLNIVDGHSMDKTLNNRDYLIASDLFYTPEPGDIVVVHDITADPYDKPIVKRVIATAGQTVDIDFDDWTLRVDGQVIDEPYRFLDETQRLLTAGYNYDPITNTFSVTVPEGEVFLLGDNRNGSADSRQVEIGTVDERCVVGRAYFRLFPLSLAGSLMES